MSAEGKAHALEPKLRKRHEDLMGSVYSFSRATTQRQRVSCGRDLIRHAKLLGKPCPKCSVLRHWTFYKGEVGYKLRNLPELAVFPNTQYAVLCPHCSQGLVEYVLGLYVTTDSCATCAGTLRIKPVHSPSIPQQMTQEEDRAFIQTFRGIHKEGPPMKSSREAILDELRPPFADAKELLRLEYTKVTGVRARAIGAVVAAYDKAHGTATRTIEALCDRADLDATRINDLENRLVEVERELVASKTANLAQIKDTHLLNEALSKSLREERTNVLNRTAEVEALSKELDHKRARIQALENRGVDIEHVADAHEDQAKALQEARSAIIDQVTKMRELTAKLDERRSECKTYADAFKVREQELEQTKGALKYANEKLAATIQSHTQVLQLRTEEEREHKEIAQELALRVIEVEGLNQILTQKDVVLSDLRREVAEMRRETASIADTVRDTNRLRKGVNSHAAPHNPQENPMTEKNPSPATAPSFTQKLAESRVAQTLAVDGTDAAWRIAGSQFVKLVKEPAIALLQRNLGVEGDPSMREKLAKFLDTELGVALLSALLSAGLVALPTNDPVATRLARELRIKFMAGAGDALADVLMGPLRQVAVMYLQGIPTEPQEPDSLSDSNPVTHVDFVQPRTRREVG